MKNNKICVFCNKEYHYCPTCGEDFFKPTWYNNFCSEECKDIYKILLDVIASKMTKEDAKKVLVETKLIDTDVVKNISNKCLREILQCNLPTVDNIEIKVENTVLNDEKDSNVIIDNVTNETISKPKRRKRTKSTSASTEKKDC